MEFRFSLIFLLLLPLNAIANIEGESKTLNVSPTLGDSSDQPLAGKQYGAEVNLARLLAANAAGYDNHLSLSGSFSYFDLENNVEIAFPVFYSNVEDNNGYDYYSDDYTLFTADAHYRLFLGDELEGFYLSAFLRSTYINGAVDYNIVDQPVIENGYSYTGTRVDSVMGDEIKVGAGIGLGYRIFSHKGFYWGTSLSIGNYLIGKNDKFVYDVVPFGATDDGQLIVDFEFLKFGFAF